MTEKEVTRKVLEAYTRDVGRGIVRLDYDTMDELNVITGDPVLLTSEKKKTAAKSLPLYPSDEKKGMIRVDGLVRTNLEIAVGNSVKITKTSAKAAEQVIVYPVESIPELDTKYLADALESVVVIAGDKVMVPYYGGRLTFKIIDTKPIGIVMITQMTEFIIEEEDLPDEIREFEEYISQRKQEFLKDIKRVILQNLKEKKYDNLKNLIESYNTEIENLTKMKKQIRKILSDEHNLEMEKTKKNAKV